MIRTRQIVATWYLHDDVSDAGYFPQALTKAGTEAAKNLYLQCVCVFFASALIRGIRDLMLFTNMTTLPEDINRILTTMGVSVVVLNNGVRPAVNKGATAWGNQFYIFDILRYVVDMPDICAAVIADSDCIWRTQPAELFADVERYGILTYNLHEPRFQRSNGLTRDDMKEIIARTFPGVEDYPVYYCGGEFFAATYEMCVRVTDIFSLNMLKLFEQFESRDGGEEAHMLSILYNALGVPFGTGNQHVKRVWTTFKYNTASISDALGTSTLLHFPSEKRTGIARIFGEVETYLKMSVSEALNFENRMLGLPRRTVLKTLQDMAALAISKSASITKQS